MHRVHLRDDDDARETYRAFRKLSAKSSKTKCCYLHGSRHEFLYEDCHDILDIDLIGEFDLQIEIQNSNKTVEGTTLKVRRTEHKSLLETITSIGEEFFSRKGGTIRNHRKDGGQMWLMGCYGKKDGKEMYSKVSGQLADKLVMWRKHITAALSALFPEEIDHIREENLRKKVSIEDDECCAAGILSRDLANSLHIDLDEYSGIVVFSEKNPGNAENWYFILGNVTRDGKRAIVIKKKHGMCICWDGRMVFHSSSTPILRNGNHVYGSWISTKL